MTIIKIDNFAGIQPRYSPRLLPNNAAVVAENCVLTSGELRGLTETSLLYDFTQYNYSVPVQRAYRLPVSVDAPIPIGPADTWLPFFDANADIVRTPVLEDSFERYYWTGDSYSNSGAPSYSTRALINAAAPYQPGVFAPFLLGIPTPVSAPTVTPPSGSTISTRAYVYTFISAYGEEGSPSSATTATGNTGSWAISGFDTTVPNASARNITTKRIYRTVSGATTSEYYWVADISLATTSYTDTQSDTVVAENFVMPSLGWTPPPATLTGICAHPGGMLVGFSGRDLWMSVPYQAHAWPQAYVQTMQTEIVGLAIYQNVIVVTTTSRPYVGEGMTPSGITMQKIDSIDPCLNRRSMATNINGVYYASPQGIMACTGGVTILSTLNLFTRVEWQEYFSPTTVQMVTYGVQVIAFDTADAGFVYSPMDPNAPLTQLDRFSNVQAIQEDQYSGDVYMIQGSQVRLWSPPSTVPYSYTWQSKQFDLPNPVNFGAFRIKFNAVPITVSIEQLSDYTTFNNARIAKPLNCINLAPINGVRTMVVPGYSGPQIRNPIGGSPLFPIGQYESGEAAIQLQITARNLNSQWVTVFSQSITDERICRMPSGFKSDAWQVQFIGNTNLYSFTMGETALELKKA